MKYLLTILLLICSSIAFGQEFELPQDITLKVADDYKKTEPLMLRSIKWLVETPLTVEEVKRQQINQFVLQWIEGSPTVTITLYDGISPADEPQCLLIFMAGWTKYSLENQYDKSTERGSIAGLESLLKFYQANKNVLGDREAYENLLSMQKKGKLKKYVRKILANSDIPVE